MEIKGRRHIFCFDFLRFGCAWVSNCTPLGRVPIKNKKRKRRHTAQIRKKYFYEIQRRHTVFLKSFNETQSNTEIPELKLRGQTHGVSWIIIIRGTSFFLYWHQRFIANGISLVSWEGGKTKEEKHMKKVSNNDHRHFRTRFLEFCIFFLFKWAIKDYESLKTITPHPNRGGHCSLNKL